MHHNYLKNSRNNLYTDPNFKKERKPSITKTNNQYVIIPYNW